jgi:hypothetical protein
MLQLAVQIIINVLEIPAHVIQIPENALVTPLAADVILLIR